MSATLAVASSVNPGFLLVGAAIGAAIGFLIGNRKQRPVLGLCLGLFLGFIGWIIIAIVPRKSGGGSVATSTSYQPQSQLTSC